LVLFDPDAPPTLAPASAPRQRYPLIDALPAEITG